MGQALYRKYRSKSLEEVVGQAHITTTLHNALKSGKISHAYLFTGPRGVGKTSVARVLARAVNDLPYDDQTSLDIIEIDAASNRRIDEVRDLRDKVHILPTSAKYKVYIIDEVHMLTREAFNALLKTLEEPPAHVIFILATTEAHKLPETIISRTQHFAFKPIDDATLTKHLRDIAKSEKISIDDGALELIAEHGGGSFRDSISLLDQVRSFGDKIAASDVQHMLGVAPAKSLNALLECLATGTPKQLLDTLAELRLQGITAAAIAKQLGNQLRLQLVQGTARPVSLMKALLDIPGSTHAERQLEIVLLEALFERQPAAATPIAPSPKIPPSPSKPSPAAKASQPDVAVPEAPSPPKPDVPKPAPPPSSAKTTPANGSFTIEDWPAVLAAVKKKHNTLYGILRMAKPELQGDTLVLGFRFAFHEKQLKDTTKRAIVTTLIRELFEADITIECLLQKDVTPKQTTTKTNDSVAIDTVSNIFGGAEVLES